MSEDIKLFLNRDPRIVAKDLLGCGLYCTDSETGQAVGGIICETEAYLPHSDPAAHNRRGKTASNSSLFSNAGTLYVHRMRQHFLIDIVTDSSELPGSVLIRAIQPLSGIELMRQRRQVEDMTQLCNGPSKLCKALGIDKRFDGQSLLSPQCFLKLDLLQDRSNISVSTSNRVGLSIDVDENLRFFLSESQFTSRRIKSQ